MPLKFANNQSLTSTTALPSAVPTDNLILISTQTASASATISFTGINGTYDEYIFKFINIHPSSDNNTFQFQGSTNGGSSYGVIITSTYFRSYSAEAGGADLNYITGSDLAQSTSFQNITTGSNLGADTDENLCGTISLYSPSSTTYVKHFIGNTSWYHADNFAINSFFAGYFNTTSAINAVQFKMASNNIDDGIIKLYGVKKS